MRNLQQPHEVTHPHSSSVKILELGLPIRARRFRLGSMDPKQLHVIQALDKAGATEHLTDREKHLIGLAVTITRGCAYCTGGRTQKALDSGITQKTLNANTDLVAAVNAGVAVRTVLQGLEGLSCDSPECA